MRTFEFLLWSITAMWAVLTVLGRGGVRRDGTLGAAAIVIAILHASFEGVRFHLVPTYLIAVVLLLLSSWRRRSPTAQRRWSVRLLFGVPVVGFIAVAGLLPMLFPVFSYDQPSGRYGIGTAEYTVPGAANHRELVIQAWYPIDTKTTGRPVGISSRPRLLAAAYASFTGLPAPLFDNIRLVKTHAIVNVTVAVDQRRFPVVLFSHGPLSANRSQSVYLMEALANNGFIAVAIDHTGYASTTIFPDGHTEGPSAGASWPAVVDPTSTTMVRTWVSDVHDVIDRLTALDAHDPNGLLTGRMDLTHVGYVGASFGGSVVVHALLKEPRISAGVAQDGKPYFFGETLSGLKRPLMYMQSARPYIPSSDAQLAQWGLTAATFKSAEQDHYARLMQLFGRTNGPIYNVYIRGTNHVTFSDLYRIIAVPDSDLIDVRRAHRIINEYTVAFFNRYLVGTSERLVDGRTPSPYDEVVVSSRNVVDEDIGD